MKHNTLPTEILSLFGDVSGLDAVAEFWDVSGTAMPAQVPDFLHPSEWRNNRQWCGLDAEVDEALARAVDRIVASPDLLRLAWHCHWRVFLAPEGSSLAEWPVLVQALGADGGILYLLVGLSLVPLVRRWHAQWGIPEEITRDTLLEVQCMCDYNFRTVHAGRPGLFPSQLGWLRHYPRERYFRIRRLEFWLAPYAGREQVFRHRRTAEVVAFAADGTRFSAAGRVFADPEHYSAGEGWTADFQRSDTHVSGYLLHPDGHGTERRVRLPLSEWAAVLESGVPTLQMHIPAGGAMTPEACRASITGARAFFARYFPAEPAVAITCGSWIFSPLLQQCLPPEANLVRFQRELFLMPSPATGTDGLWFVFFRHGMPDFQTWPRDTSVQRAILDYLEAGHLWGAGRMVFLMEDAPRFGRQVYRRAWPPRLTGAD